MTSGLPVVSLNFYTWEEFFEFVRKTGNFVIALKGEQPIFQQLLQQQGEIMTKVEELNAKIDELQSSVDAERVQVNAELLAIKEKINAGTIAPADIDAAIARLETVKTSVGTVSEALDTELQS